MTHRNCYINMRNDQMEITCGKIASILNEWVYVKIAVRGFDGDTSFLFVFTGVGKASFSCLCTSDDTGFTDQ